MSPTFRKPLVETPPDDEELVVIEDETEAEPASPRREHLMHGAHLHHMSTATLKRYSHISSAKFK